ncbi:MAG: hypothetical protein ACYDHY_17300 [Acidiferrobacterales bacterium]
MTRVIAAGAVLTSTPPEAQTGDWLLILKSPEGPLTVRIPRESAQAGRVAQTARPGDFVIVEGHLRPNGGECDVVARWIVSTREHGLPLVRADGSLITSNLLS